MIPKGKGFSPEMFGEDVKRFEELDWENFKIGCPCNPIFAKSILHYVVADAPVKCNASNFECTPIMCPYLYWLAMYFQHGESLFQFLERAKQ